MADNMDSFPHFLSMPLGHRVDPFYGDASYFRSGVSHLWPAGQIQPVSGIINDILEHTHTLDVSMAVHNTATELSCDRN